MASTSSNVPTIWISSFPLLVLLILTCTSASFVSGSNMTRLGSASGVPGGYFYSAIIDTTNQVGYFGTYTNPGTVVQFNLSTMTRIGSASGVSGENYFYSAIIDATSQVGYFGTSTYPGIVVKFNLATMTRIGSASGVSGENRFYSAIIDTTNQVGYFGTDTHPGIVIKFNLTTMKRIGNASGVPGESYFYSAVIDATSQVGYFGTSTYPGIVVKFNLTTMTRIGNASGIYNEHRFYSAIIDTTNQVGYFGTYTDPGIVVKFNLATMERIGRASGVSGENSFRSAIIDTTNQVGYFASLASRVFVVKFNLTTMTRIGSASGFSSARNFYSAIIDTTNQVGYFGTNTNPGTVVKFNLATMERIRSARGVYGARNFYSAIIDTTNQVGYFGTGNYPNPGFVVKFNLATMERIGRASGASGEGSFRSAIIDTTRQVGYFGAYAYPGIVVKFNLTTMTRIGSASGVSGESDFFSAIIDTTNQVGYFGTDTSRGIVVKFNLTTMTRIGRASGASGERSFRSAIIDTTRQVGYFGTNTSPGIVVKFNLATMTRIGSASGVSGENRFYSAIIDTTNQVGYLGTMTSPGIVVKFNLTTMTRIGNASGVSGESYFYSAVIDATSQVGYFGTGTNPGIIVKFNLTTMTRIGNASGIYGENRFYSAIIDTTNQVGYFGTGNNAGFVVKFSLDTTTISSCGEHSVLTGYVDVQTLQSPCPQLIIRESSLLTLVISEQHSIDEIVITNIKCSRSTYESCIFFSSMISNVRKISIRGISRRNLDSAAGTVLSVVNFVGALSGYESSNSTLLSISDVSFSDSILITRFSSFASFDLSVIRFGRAISNFDRIEISHMTFENVQFNVVSNTSLIRALSLSSVFGNTTQVAITNSSVSDFPSACTASTCSFIEFTSSSSETLIEGVWSFSNISMIQPRGSFPFMEISESSVVSAQFTFSENSISNENSNVLSIDDSQHDDPILPHLNSSTWIIGCNNWSSSVDSRLYLTLSRIDFPCLMFRCRTQSLSMTHSQTTSLSTSASTSLFPSTSPTTSLSPSTSISTSESVYCYNLNEIECSRVGLNNCHFCSDRQTCVPRENDCGCFQFSESLCDFASSGMAKGCHFCSNADICVDEVVDCECYVFGQTACQLATSACRWCPNFKSCLPVREGCYCSSLSKTPCDRLSDNKCKYCGDQQICLPVEDVNVNKCSCMKMNSSNCQQSTCTWCSGYQICSVPEWDCNCLSYSNDSTSCTVSTNNHCKYCSDEDVCVDTQKVTCRCDNFTQSACDASSCKWCDDLNSCSVPQNTNCSCYYLRGEDSCSESCRWCPNFKSCLPLREDCYCSSLSGASCDHRSDNKCKYCGDQQICLPVEDVNVNKCSCMKMNSSNCQQSTCTWCSEYQTCSVPEWDCNCLSYSNDSTSCVVSTNNHCKYCSDEDVCVDTHKFTCRCENFTQSACDASSCKWCDDLKSCSVPQNTNCSCYYLRGEDSCSLNSNENCKWCAESTDTGKDGQNKLEDFNYCVNKEQDQCECSYLSPSFCSFTTTANASAMKFSSTCRYCEVDQICSHPSNTECDCGNFLSSHACGLATSCSWKEPVLTIDGGSEYCSAAAACASVTCAGILSPASCRSSGCEWDSTTSRCTSSTCFNFFINGFTVQPFLMYVIGLFKDVLVVFLIGAFSALINRPVMKFITSVKKKIKNQTHIKQQMMEHESNVYISDKSCRDGLEMSFAQYVDKVCESVFELESEDLLDEKNRLKLFDTVAFTLFDNMIWLDLDLMKATAKASSFATSAAFESEEMEDLGNTDHEQKHDHGGNDNDEELISCDEPPPAPTAHLPSKRITAPEVVQNLVEKALTHFRMLDSMDEADVNSQGQVLTQFVSLAHRETMHFLKTKNVDLLKIKVILSETDFESAVNLRKKVEDALVERASAYVFYDQSRSRMVCGATGMNTFPPALSLLYYTIAIVALFISSFITVLNTENIHRMVSTCENSLVSEESPSSISNSTNETTFAPSSNSTTNSTTNSSTAIIDQQGTILIDGTFLTGAYFLLGFRLLNASAFSTAILVFVKTLRGIYQKYSGIYSLTLQERIPLMSLYSDRLIHIVLFIYALLVLPFALAGPFYGGFALSFHCWVPIFIAAAILCGDALILFISRKISSFRKQMNSSSSSTKRLDADGLALDFDDQNSTDVSLLPSSSSRGNENDDAIKEQADAIHSPREAQRDDDVDDDEPTTEEVPALPSENSNTSEGASSPALDKDVVEQQSSISSSSPVEIWNALLVFVLTEEIPVIVISLALQASFNYCALLQYGDAFGVSHDHSTVYRRDYDSRKIECIIRMFQSDVSSFLSGLSSFVPFM